ncbi:phage integrase N-terminal SAM-like domain-containing protein [Polycladomyces sp. WAk]|uniref:Phage integrase N-terminal SAM-like domain-containing protein n=1 Tax=Polycladomyces zharkentensis TaxID=2807616 RepID=A0ABS2WL98_9BACL|nr:phage integrase N-terminal SAM-like domain-containing protein [Polycladomyces sp. WAk]
MNYLDRFESRLKEEWKRTPTIDVYLRSVRFFEKWYTESVNDDFEPDNITALDIQDWRQHMQIQDKLHPTTINKRISSLKVYWSCRSGFCHSRCRPEC